MRYLIIVLGWLLGASCASAVDLPSPLTPFVNDFAEVIDTDTEARITADLQELRNDQDIEMTVVTLPSRSDFSAGDTLEAFASSLFNDWGIGNADRNDGIMMLVLVEDREMRLELGSGYGVEQDARAQRIVDHTILPYFREGRFGAGIEAGVLETIAQLSEGSDAALSEHSKPNPIFAWFERNIIPLLMGAGFVLLAFRQKISDQAVKLRRCPQCGRRMLNRDREITRKATRDRDGLREIRTTCGNCDYHDRQERRYRFRSSSSGSGGSFGGGRSSGGGASGRW